jgi:hydroxypyruvate isomerase
VWRSAEIQRLDLRDRSQRLIAREIESAIDLALATGCRRLEIELGDHDELEARVVNALNHCVKRLQAHGTELIIERRPVRAVGAARRQLERDAPRSRGVWPPKWAA